MSAQKPLMIWFSCHAPTKEQFNALKHYRIVQFNARTDTAYQAWMLIKLRASLIGCPLAVIVAVLPAAWRDEFVRTVGEQTQGSVPVVRMHMSDGVWTGEMLRLIWSDARQRAMLFEWEPDV